MGDHQAGRRWRTAAMTLLVMVIMLGAAVHFFADRLLDRFALTTGPNGPETPGALSIPFDRMTIPSAARKLDSYVVHAPKSCIDAPVLLIYHGIQETISDWVRAQSVLYNHCVSSVIFDSAGTGDSSRPARLEFVRQDALAAYDFTVSQFPGSRIFVLGHSMGNGVMLEQIPHFRTPPSGVIVASAFSSLRNQGVIRKHLFYRLMAYAIPDWWNNVRAVKQIRAPLLVVHSDSDRVNPVADGQAIYAAANQPKSIVILHGFGHNALETRSSDEWWGPVVSFIQRPPAN